MATNDHITEAEMKSFCAGALPARSTILCAEHLENCAECSRLFAGVSGAGSYYQPFKIQFPKEDELFADVEEFADEDLDSSGNPAAQHADQTEGENAFFPRVPRVPRENFLSFRTEAPDPVERKRDLSGWRQRLPGIFVGKPIPRLIPLTAAMAVVIALIVLAWFLFQRRTVPAPRQFHAGPALPATPRPVEKTPEIESPPVNDESASATPQLPKRKRLVADSPALTAALFDRGRWIRLNASGQITGIENQPAEIREDLATVLRGEKLDRASALDELANADIIQRGNRGGDDELRLLRPVETLIKEDQPVLRWVPMKEADWYVVKIVDDSFNPIAESPTLSSAEWRVDQPLKRDTAYIWQVTAYRNQEAIERNADRIARFKVISARKLEEIEAISGKFESNLALAVFYAREGLLDEAEKELDKIFADPRNAPQAEKIYRAVLPNRVRAQPHPGN